MDTGIHGQNISMHGSMNVWTYVTGMHECMNAELHGYLAQAVRTDKLHPSTITCFQHASLCMRARMCCRDTSIIFEACSSLVFTQRVI